MTTPHQSGYAIGIDLGTSNTIAVVRSPDGRTRPLLFDGQPIMPSVVYLDDSGNIHVGRDAQRMAQLDPARCEPNPKRRIDEGTILLGSAEVPVVRLLSMILKVIADKAVETVGFLPPAAITHPAAWGATRRGILLEAVRQAGWPPVKLVPEPIAAARYFTQVMRRPVPVGSSIAVFDFGGGTLDVAVVRHEQDGSYTVTASGGDENLGGLDLDSALVTHVGTLIGRQRPEIWQHLSRPTSTADRRYRRLFWEDVRGAKEMLSRSTTAPVPVPGADHAVHLTREEMERLCGPLLQRAVLATETTIGQTGLRADGLSGMFLVGGSSRVPLVSRMLHSRLGIAPTVLEQPELPVAEGALAELVPLGEQTMPMNGPASGVPYPMSAMPAGGGMPVSSMPASPGGPVSPVPGPYPPQGPPPNGGYGNGFGANGIPVGPPPRAPWYKRKGIMIPAASAVVVLLVLAGFAIFYDPYGEQPFVPFKQSATIKYGSETPNDTWLKMDGDMGFLADTTSSGDGTSSANSVTARGLTLGDKKVKWSKSIVSPNQNDWASMSAGAGVVVLPYKDTINDTGDTVPGGATVLDEKSGKQLWSKADGMGDSDWWSIQSDPQLVLHYKSSSSVLTAYDPRSGKVKWSAKNVGEDHEDVSYESFSGPSDFTVSETFSQTKMHSSTLVLIKDGVAQLFDTATGKSTGHRSGIGDGTHIVFNGVLYDAGTGDGYSVNAYALNNFDSNKWGKAAPSGWKLRDLDVCAETVLCAAEYKATTDDTATSPTAQRIRLIDAKTGNTKKIINAPDSNGAVPVGDRFMISYKKDGRVYTDVYDDDGDKQTDTPWAGEAARLDHSEALVANNDVFGLDGSSDSPEAKGFQVSGGGVQSKKQDPLGNIDQNLNDCYWNDAYIMCPDDDAGQFVVTTFR